jgi:hypothetical protein
MTAGLVPTDSPPKVQHLGPFDIVGRVVDSAPHAGRIVLSVTGTADGPFAGRDAIATCIAKPTDEAELTGVRSRLESLKTIRHPNLQPVLDADIAGNVAWWATVKPAIASLAETPRPAPYTPAETRQIVREAASALATAHAARLVHGSISQVTIARRPDGAIMVCGLGLSGKRPEDDQRALALTLIELLGGTSWIAPESADDPVNDSANRTQALRTHLSNITERLVAVLERASGPHPAGQFGTIATFADAYEAAVALSAEDLAHGAFEAISAQSAEIADLMYQRASDYDPDCEMLTVLRIQLYGGSLFNGAHSNASPAAVPAPDQAHVLTDSAPPPVPLMAQAPTRTVDPVSLIPPELAAGLPEEYLQSVAQQFAIEPVKKPRFNPIFVLILGGLGMLILLLIAILLTWSLSGS